LTTIDSTGEWIEKIIGEQNTLALGNWANTLATNNSVAQYALDHPYQTGVASGLLGGALVAGGVVLGGGTIACGVLCGGGAATLATTGTTLGTQGNKDGSLDYITRYGPNLSSKMNEVHKIFQKEGLDFSPHLVERTVERLNRGITPDKVVDTINTGTKYFDKLHSNYSYFKDGIRVVQELNGQLKTVVTQPSMNADRFIQLFKK